MSHRIAVTTRDGKVVQEHFGHARHFHIVDLDDDGYRYLESRELRPLCPGEPGASHSCQVEPGASHSVERFGPALELLADCDAVVTAQIGPGAAAHVIAGGLRVFEGRGFVDEILQQIIAGRLLDEPGEAGGAGGADGEAR
jgi:predicted Fe-Mo cluster-binding NifX family protein